MKTAPTVPITLNGVAHQVAPRVATMLALLLAAERDLARHPHGQLRFDWAGDHVRPSLKVPLGPGQGGR